MRIACEKLRMMRSCLRLLIIEISNSILHTCILYYSFDRYYSYIYRDICRNRFMESIQDPVLQFTYMARRENMSKIYKLCLREYSIKVKTDVP